MNSLNFILSVIKSNFNYNDGSKIVEDLKKETCDLNDKINEIVINFFKFYSEKNIIIDESPEPNKNPLFSLGNIQKKLRSTEYSQYQIKILNFVCHSIIKNKLNLSLENEINSIFLASTQMIGSSKIYSRSNKLREEILQPFFYNLFNESSISMHDVFNFMKVSKEILSPRLNKKKYTCSDLVNFLKIREDSINKINKNEEINFFKKEFYSFKETFAEKSLSYIYKGCIKHKITPGIYKKKEYRGESIVEKKEELLMYCETMGPIIKILNLSSLTELEAKDIENICSWCPNIEVLWLSYMNNNNLKNCLQYLEKLKNLKELELIFWNNDMDIEVISKLKNLRILNLCGADLTNQDFELLGNLENLERLLLVKCRKITREGLISFLQKPLKEIKYINLDYTRFYEEDCENLKNDPLFIKKYPNLEIVSCKRFRG